MKENQHRAALVLMELILSLFLFALCAAVCVGLLLHARGMSGDSRDLTNAVYQAQSFAEQWQADGALPPSGGAATDGLSTKGVEEGDTLLITVSKGDKVIYTLEGVRRHE